MTEIREYSYCSVLAPYMEGLVAEKRRLGFFYNGAAYQLKRFDTYWLSHGYEDEKITLERAEEWLRPFPGESKSSHGSRVRALRRLAAYMISLGISAYVPLLSIGNDHNVVHVPSRQEITELFDVVDHYKPVSPISAYMRMADEYPIMFRFYYCCGMRNNEVCSLKVEDVDLQKGIITIRNGKNHKERLVYMAEDLRMLAEKYYAHLKDTLGHEPLWFFPGKNPQNPMPKTTIDMKFRQFWEMTADSKVCDKRPTPHCLRHAYVVNRMNQWILSGLDVNVMLPYLSKYLGHESPEESFYYYHMVADAFQIIRMKDITAPSVIPEVRRR